MIASVSPVKAVSLALVAYTCWVLADTCLKVAGRSRLPTGEVIAVVGLVEVGLLLARGLWRGDVGALWPRNPLRQVFRSCLDLANNVCVVIALRHLPLPLFYILIFFAPMATALLAAAFLGESLEWRKALAIFAGFVGVVIAVNPFGVSRSGDWTGYLACLVCVMCFAVNVVWSRVMTQTQTPESLTFCSGALMALAGSASVLRNARPLDVTLAGVLAGAGLFSVVGGICFFIALKHASAATVSQYHYSQLLSGALIGYVIWGERLALSMLVGAALIIAAGCYSAAGLSGRGVIVGAAAGSG